jgi:oleandomycin transport system ATP-binding protein
VVRDLVGDDPVVEGDRLTVPVSDPTLLPAAVRRFDDAGVLLAELTLRSSSLNEVFLSLTGHRAGHESGSRLGDTEFDDREEVPA